MGQSLLTEFYVFVLAVFVLPAPVAAQTATHDHSTAAKTAAPPSKAARAEGEVRAVDRAKGTVVLKHGPLEALGMPAMTMEFAVTDPKLLANVRKGDKVRFMPEQGKNGQIVVTAIEVVKG